MKKIINFFKTIWPILKKVIPIILGLLAVSLLREKAKKKDTKELEKKIDAKIKEVNKKTDEVKKEVKKIKDEHEEIKKRKKERDEVAKKYFPNLGE